jgi:hypothetical protein
MATPQLYRQLIEQLGQWIVPKDLRHLKNCAEIIAAILESESACLAHWIPYLSLPFGNASRTGLSSQKPYGAIIVFYAQPID